MIKITIEIEKKKKRKGELKAQYLLNPYKIICKMATINVPGDKTTVNGVLVPLQNGNPIDISNLVPDSDSYFSSNGDLVTVSKNGNFEFTVKRNSDAGGTVEIKYTATNLKGDQIGGGDTFIFDPVVVPVFADALSAKYSDPV